MSSKTYYLQNGEVKTVTCQKCGQQVILLHDLRSSGPDSDWITINHMFNDFFWQIFVWLSSVILVS